MVCDSFLDTMQQYDIQRFASLGVNQSSFLRHLYPAVRYTLFLSQAGKSYQHGAMPLADLMASEDYLDSVFIVDRSGSLGSSFAPFIDSAAKGISASVGLTPQTLRQTFAFKFQATATLVPSLALLSSRPTLRQLIDTADAFAKQHHLVFDTTHRTELLRLLQLLRTMHMISFETTTTSATENSRQVPFARGKPIVSGNEETATLKDQSRPSVPHDSNSILKARETLPASLGLQEQRLRDLGFTDDFISRFFASKAAPSVPAGTAPANSVGSDKSGGASLSLPEAVVVVADQSSPSRSEAKESSQITSEPRNSKHQPFMNVPNLPSYRESKCLTRYSIVCHGLFSPLIVCFCGKMISQSRGAAMQRFVAPTTQDSRYVSLLVSPLVRVHIDV